MPNKDPERRKEVVRNAVKRYRERKKEEKNKTIISPDGLYKGEIIESADEKYRIALTTNTDKPLTKKEQKKLDMISKLLEESAELLPLEDTIKILHICFDDQEEEEQPGFKSVLEFIPNLLSLGTDLQMLKHRGGTA